MGLADRAAARNCVCRQTFRCERSGNCIARYVSDRPLSGLEMTRREGMVKGVAKNRRIDLLCAEKPTGNTDKKDFENGDRNIVAKNGIDNAATDNGRHAKKNQDPQLPTDIHLEKSPVYYYPDRSAGS